MGIVTAAEEANKAPKAHLAQHVKRAFGSISTGKTFAIWGLAFKPNTDDMRDAPSITIIEELLSAGAKIRTFDPVATENAKKVIQGARFL